MTRKYLIKKLFLSKKYLIKMTKERKPLSTLETEGSLPKLHR